MLDGVGRGENLAGLGAVAQASAEIHRRADVVVTVDQNDATAGETTSQWQGRSRRVDQCLDFDDCFEQGLGFDPDEHGTVTQPLCNANAPSRRNASNRRPKRIENVDRLVVTLVVGVGGETAQVDERERTIDPLAPNTELFDHHGQSYPGHRLGEPASAVSPRAVSPSVDPMSDAGAGALCEIDDWPGTAAAAAVRSDGTMIQYGDIERVFELASVTKLVTAMALLVAHEEGTVALDQVEPHTGATVADVLAHAGGVAFDTLDLLHRPRHKRIYSSTGYELLADLLAARAGMPFAEYLHLAVTQPLGMTTFSLDGSAGAGGRGSVTDLLRLTAAWRTPILVHDATLERARATHLPELDGVVPGFGHQSPNPWGLGPEKRGHKSPHWTAPSSSAETYGHFGRAGTMLWIDPEAAVTLVALCTEPFGPWATTAWPLLSETVLAWARSIEPEPRSTTN